MFQFAQTVEAEAWDDEARRKALQVSLTSDPQDSSHDHNMVA